LSAADETDESRVLIALDGLPVSHEALAQFVGLSPVRLQAAILKLELAGLVRATARGYIRAS